MKQKNKSRQSKGSIAQLVLGLIKSKNLEESSGKDAATILLPVVKRQFPGSKFSISHVYWYLARYRRQLRAKVDTNHLVELLNHKGEASNRHLKKTTKKNMAKAK